MILLKTLFESHQKTETKKKVHFEENNIKSNNEIWT